MSDAVDARGRRTAHNAAAVNTDFAVTEIIHQHQHDVRLAFSTKHRMGRCQWRQGQQKDD